MKYLVTGGAGFIGSHICKALVEKGGEVVVLDNLNTGKRENLAELKDNFSFIYGDIRDLEIVRQSMKDVDIVYHEAAIASVPDSVEDPLYTHDVNLTGMLNVLIAAKELGIRRLVYASSAATYGDDPVVPKVETMNPEFLSPYAFHKYAGEIYAQQFGLHYGLETVGLRYFNVFGPRQDPSSMYSGVISLFMECFMNNCEPTVFGDGEQTRDFIFVKDVVQANILAGHSEGHENNVFNVGLGKQTSLNQLLDYLRELTGKNLNAIYTDPRPGDIRHSLSDNSKIIKAYGFKPEYTVSEGLRVTYEWFLGQSSS